MSEIAWLMAITASAFQVADYWLTVKILERGGVELNPVMAWLLISGSTKGEVFRS